MLVCVLSTSRVVVRGRRLRFKVCRREKRDRFERAIKLRTCLRPKRSDALNTVQQERASAPATTLWPPPPSSALLATNRRDRARIANELNALISGRERQH